jgi:hypothetical protein
MNLSDPQVMMAIVIVVALLAIASFLHFRRHQSHVLEKRFGNEYGRTVEEFGGSRGKAEAELRAREKRVEQLNIVPLAHADAVRFRDEWRALQARFVDNPQSAATEADHLVRDLMQKRGYPMGDFDSRAADISVHHPAVVEHYRAAHDIALRNREGKADTEALRQALIHYRALFADLLEVESDPEQRQAATTPNGMRRH